jgi:hypothetical protein
MNKSETINKLAPALSKLQAEIPMIPFDAEAYRYKYATLGAIIEATKPLLEKHGFSIPQLVVGDGSKVGVETILLHESGEWISETVWLFMDESNTGNTTAQKAGANITYLRRYSLASVLKLYSDEDTDASNQPVTTNRSETVSKTKAVPEPTAERPYKPEILKQRLAEISNTQKDATDKQRKLLVFLLAEQLPDDDIRHDAQEYLFGERSLNDVDGKMVNAALKWLDISQDSGGAYIPSEVARKELSAVQSAFLMSKGQQKMDDLLKDKGI